MAGHVVLVVVVSLATALCYAGSYVIEQRKASEAPEETAMSLRLLWHLMADPVWWLAIFMDFGAFGLEIVALGLGAIVFVQPLLLTSLPLSLLIGHRVGSHVLRRSDVAWAFVFIAALTTFLVLADPGGGVARRPIGSWIPVLVPVVVVTALAWATASRLDTIRRSLVLGLTAGMLFGVTSALMKSFADVVTSDGWRLFVHWEPYTMVAVGIAGFVMMQSAFQAGDLRTSLPAIDLAEPLVAGTVGVLLFSEKLRVHGPIQGAAAVLAVVVMAVSAIRLARSAAGEPPGAPDAVVDEPARVDDEASVEPPEGRSIEPV